MGRTERQTRGEQRQLRRQTVPPLQEVASRRAEAATACRRTHSGRVALNASDVLSLQRAAGNIAVSHLLRQATPAVSMPRTAGNRGTASLAVQRSGGPPPVLGYRKVPTGEVLLHGSVAQAFVWIHGGGSNRVPTPWQVPHPPAPSPPAWFATDREFSLHAAVLSGEPYCQPGHVHTLWLHQYTVKSPLDMIVLADCRELGEYLKSNQPNWVISGDNGANEARAMFAENAQMDGYIVEKDAVRGELELVLGPMGIAKLAPSVIVEDFQMKFRHKWRSPHDDRNLAWYEITNTQGHYADYIAEDEGAGRFKIR